MDKRQLSTGFAKYVLNPVVKTAVRAGIPLPGIAIIETTGRKSGQPRRTPVGKAVEGDILWVVAEHGHKAAWVRNIKADPHVRVRLGRRWRTATAHPLPDDDPRGERQRRIPNKANSAVVRVMQTDLLTVRIDLD